MCRSERPPGLARRASTPVGLAIFVSWSSFWFTADSFLMFIVLSRSRGCTGEAPCSCPTHILAEGAMICLVKICPHSPLGYRVEAEACNNPLHYEVSLFNLAMEM